MANNEIVNAGPVATITRDAWLRSFMDDTKLKKDGSNFTDWEAALRNAAIADGKLKYLIEPIPAEPNTRSGAQRIAYDEFVREAGAIKNVLIYAMEHNLQRRFITQSANKIFTTLTNEFSQAPRIVKYDTAVRFFEAKLQKGQAVSPHVLNMIENVEKLEELGCKINENIVIDRILHSLHDGYTQFRVNYNMNDMNKSLHELHSLLVQAEKDLNMSGSVKRDVLMIKSKGKGKAMIQGNLKAKKQFFKRPTQSTPMSGHGGTSNSKGKKKSKGDDQQCHHCQKYGHWRRNCPKYLDDIKAGRVTPTGFKGRATSD